jgi:hypothetical protein
MIEFHSELPTGFELSVKGQRYRLMKIKPHIKSDGTPSRLADWQTTCAECGAVMHTSSPATQAPASRRCELHRKPGVKVGK